MKRSEMVHEIQQYLLVRFGDEEKFKNEAHEILQLVESCGMIPPRVRSAYELWGFNPYPENNYWEDENV